MIKQLQLIVLPCFLIFVFGCSRPREPESQSGPQPELPKEDTAKGLGSSTSKDDEKPGSKSGPTDPSPYATPSPTATIKPPEITPVEIDEELRGWIVRRADSDLRTRKKAQEFLDALGDELVVVLLTAMGSDSAELRVGAAFDLSGRFNPRDERMVYVFQAALDDPDARVRSIALRTVGQMSPKDLERVMPRLAEMLVDSGEKSHDRAQAARLLGLLGKVAEAHFPALRKAIGEDPDRAVRLAALGVLPEIAPDPPHAVAVLADSLANDKDEAVRRKAAVTLGDYQRYAVDAVPTLVTALKDDSPRVRKAAAATLGDIGPLAGSAVSALKTATSDEDPMVREAAAAALTRVQGNR